MTGELTLLKKITTKIGSGATPRGGNNSYKTEGITLIRSLNVYDFEFSYGGLAFINEEQASETRLARVIVEPKDILLNITGASVARCCIVPEHLLPARVNQHVSLVRVDPNRADSHYVLYCINSPVYKHQLLTLAQGGATREALTQEIIGNLEIPLPSIPTQREIANFLDRKTGQINELIRIKERRIELLQEQRTALINQAVTKGLDPNVEMKPSGVEWIGEIPKHWKIRKNKHIFDERNDRSVAGNEELLTVSHITGVSPRIEKNVNMFLAETLEGYKHCSVGNLVINTMWAWMGALGISEFDGIVSPSYNVYQLKNGEYLPKYYDYLYRTPNHVSEIIRWSKGVWHSRLRLYPDAFFSMSTITPPFIEQVYIVDFLNHKNQQIDELIAAEQRKIELLKEYRQSLISELVTGKIDVQSEV